MKKKESEFQTNNENLNSEKNILQINCDELLAKQEGYINRIELLERQALMHEQEAKRTLAFQLGDAIIKATNSWGGLISLPKKIFHVNKEAKRRRTTKTALSSSFKKKKIKSSRLLHYTTLKTSTPLHSLRIASVMDEFTYHSFSPECDLLQIKPENWKLQFNSFKPQVFFIESAWKGTENLWQTKISNADNDIRDIIKFCNQNEIPVIFWNKEDPVHFGTFISIALLADYVFTTDIDCIPKYKYLLGHDRVFLLPFAAQPQTHNPVEIFERKDAFNFAGSYYLRYPERQRDFHSLISAIEKYKNIDIFDRNYDNPHPHYTYPARYKPYILGKLPFTEINRAYKGYRYGINMNTIKQSQSMFARRVFELLASNTIVVSNFSRGMRILFGDLVISSDESSQLEKKIHKICNDELYYRKLRLLGLRKVMSEHTYADRLNNIYEKISNTKNFTKSPHIAVVGVADNMLEYEQLVKSFYTQKYNEKQLHIVKSYTDTNETSVESDVLTYNDPNSCVTHLIEKTPGIDYFALFHVDDYYGGSYLTDLELTSKYSNAEAFGKAAFYKTINQDLGLQNDGTQYRSISSLWARSSLAKASVIDKKCLSDLLNKPTIATYQFKEMLATDEFNYCQNGKDSSEKTTAVINDLELSNQGISTNSDLFPLIDKLKARKSKTHNDRVLPKMDSKEIYELIKKPSSKKIHLLKKKNSFIIESKLTSTKHVYLYFKKIFSRKELNLILNSQFILECESTLELKTVFEFQDINGEKIAHAMHLAGEKHSLAIPETCEFILFGLRIQGSGKVTIQRLILGSPPKKPCTILTNSPYLVLTKQYPSYDDLYRYGFLHSRVRAYKDHGLETNIFRITNESDSTYREFEGVDVASGDAKLLDETLKVGKYKHILVHLIDANMWKILEKHIENIKVTIWVHGAEIQVWQRREFEFEGISNKEITRQKKLSDNRAKFWKHLLNKPHQNLKIIFVSNYFKKESLEDLNLKIESKHSEVIHNFIDTKIFSYEAKKPEQRKKVLSIRPYASRKYANDISVKAIIELSQKSFFKDMMFHFIGDGILFEKTLAPLRQYENVTIEQRFLSQKEMSSIHKEYGVFLTPTRMDAQGVSRDEAMSSGLVPITTNITAIPEFVDNDCGMLVPPEDSKSIADAIEFLYYNPDEFLKKSELAAQRVQKQSGFEQTIKREIELIIKDTKCQIN